MKILITVEFYEPRKGGAEEVVKQIAERFVENGHYVCVATSFLDNRKTNIINSVNIRSFKISGSFVKGINGDDAEVERYKNLLINGGFDVIFNYTAQVWTTDLMFDVLDEIKSKKILAPVGYSGLNNPKYKKYFEKLPEYLKKYDLLIYHSSSYQDYEFGEKKGFKNKAVVIPNGASADEFLNSKIIDVKEKLNIKTKFLIISVSNHYKAKGHHFVIRAFKKIKRKDATLLIIGNKFVSYGWRKWGHFVLDYLGCWLSSVFNKRIILNNGKNREFVISAYKQADLFLFGSKIECAPLVMYESFASKTPFISTPVGNVPDYKNIVKIIKNENEMSKTANYLLDNDKIRKNIAKKAFSEWKEKYTWDKIAEEYERLFKSLIYE